MKTRIYAAPAVKGLKEPKGTTWIISLHTENRLSTYIFLIQYFKCETSPMIINFLMY